MEWFMHGMLNKLVLPSLLLAFDSSMTVCVDMEGIKFLGGID
jgi:hypothetical protein